MYQTVGHSGLRTMAAALGLPFYSQVIGGTAVELGGEYGSREGQGKGKEGEEGEGKEKDETEDLFELLKKVKVRFLLSLPFSSFSHFALFS
jgi:diphthine-ammonia ligase